MCVRRVCFSPALILFTYASLFLVVSVCVFRCVVSVAVFAVLCCFCCCFDGCLLSFFFIVVCIVAGI